MDTGTTVALACVAALLAAGLAWAVRARPHLARTRAGWALVRDCRGSDGSRVRLLVAGGGVQSACWLDGGHDEAPFPYLRRFDVVFDVAALRGGRVRRAALLGGGAFAWPRQALAAHPDLSLVVAEDDPAVLAIARRWFGLGELERACGGRLEARCVDARALLEELAGSDSPLDAVANDCFRGRTADSWLWSDEGLSCVRAALAPGGTYVANVACGDDVAQLHECCRRAAGHFASVWVLPADGGDDEPGNYVLVASDLPLELADGFPFAPGA